MIANRFLHDLSHLFFMLEIYWHESMWLERATCIDKIEHIAEKLPDPYKKDVISTLDFYLISR